MLSDATQLLARIGFFSSTFGVHIATPRAHGSTLFSEVSGTYDYPAHGLMNCAWFDWSGEMERGVFFMQ